MEEHIRRFQVRLLCLQVHSVFPIQSVAFKRVSTWGACGALAGCAWYVWFDYLLSKRRSNLTFTTYGVGYSLFGGVLAATAFHPRYFYQGVLLGLFVGSFAYMVSVGQFNNGKNQYGFAYEIPNLVTEEERKLWKQKDDIFQLGQVYELKAMGLKDL